MASFSLTQELLECDKAAYEKATQSPFLLAAAKGQLHKDILGQWLANDRMYIHNYISGCGRILATCELPATSDRQKEPLFAVVDWLIEALANVRREEHFFLETARKYDIAVDLPVDQGGKVAEEAKIAGLKRFEKLFNNVEPSKQAVLPWLEDAVVMWATEKCYLDAWSWAKAQQDTQSDSSSDADGGALRDEFIPNWSSPEFRTFVDKLGAIIDKAAKLAFEKNGEQVKSDLSRRAQSKWSEVLDAEKLFWPQV